MSVFRNKNFVNPKKPILLIVFVLLLLTLGACGGKTPDDNNNDPGNGNIPPVNVPGTNVPQYPGSTLFGSEEGLFLYSTTTDSTVVYDYYKANARLEPTVAMDTQIGMGIFQTELFALFMDMPSIDPNESSDSVTKKFEAWEAKIKAEFDKSGGLAVVFVLSASMNEVQFSDMVGEEYLSSIPPGSKTVIMFRFIELDFD